MSKFVDEEAKETAKEAVDKVEKATKPHKRLIGEILVVTGLSAIFCTKLRKTRLTTNQASFDMGKLAGRAEYAEELAALAVKSGIGKN